MTDPSRDPDDAPNASAAATKPGAPGAADAGTAAAPRAAHGKKLSPEAVRALEEAEARRQAEARQDLPTEIGGRDGPEATRYGDWEKKGLAVDF
jgi:hypothetical protein